MFNKIILEGSITDIEYITLDNHEVKVNGTLLSIDNENTNSKLAIYFYIEGALAKRYYKKLFKNTKVLFKGKLKLLKWEDNSKNTKARYCIDIQSIDLINHKNIDNKKFSILYSRDNNSFINQT